MTQQHNEQHLSAEVAEKRYRDLGAIAIPTHEQIHGVPTRRADALARFATWILLGN